jgi:hypothetical protein
MRPGRASSLTYPKLIAFGLVTSMLVGLTPIVPLGRSPRDVMPSPLPPATGAAMSESLP